MGAISGSFVQSDSSFTHTARLLGHQVYTRPVVHTIQEMQVLIFVYPQNRAVVVVSGLFAKCYGIWKMSGSLDRI